EQKERQMDHILGPDSNVLVTGATGFIGGEVMRRLEAFTRGCVWCLVRSRGGEGPAERLAARYRRTGRGCRPRPNVPAIRRAAAHRRGHRGERPAPPMGPPG